MVLKPIVSLIPAQKSYTCGELHTKQTDVFDCIVLRVILLYLKSPPNVLYGIYNIFVRNRAYEITRRIQNDDNEMGRILAVVPLEIYSLVSVSLVYDEFKFLVNCDALWIYILYY